MTDRNEFGESSLVSLAEHGVRNDLALSAAYLGGVFGSIPEIAKGGAL